MSSELKRGRRHHCSSALLTEKLDEVVDKEILVKAVERKRRGARTSSSPPSASQTRGPLWLRASEERPRCRSYEHHDRKLSSRRLSQELPRPSPLESGYIRYIIVIRLSCKEESQSLEPSAHATLLSKQTIYPSIAAKSVCMRISPAFVRTTATLIVV